MSIKKLLWSDIGLNPNVDPYQRTTPMAVLRFVHQGFEPEEIVDFLLKDIKNDARLEVINYIEKNPKTLAELYLENMQNIKNSKAEYNAYIVANGCDRLIQRTGHQFSGEITMMFEEIDQVIADDETIFYDKDGKEVSESEVNENPGKYTFTSKWVMQKYINSEGFVVYELRHCGKLSDLNLEKLADYFIANL